MGVKNTVEELWETLTRDEKLHIIRLWNADKFTYNLDKVKRLEYIGIINGWVCVKLIIDYQNDITEPFMEVMYTPAYFVRWKVNELNGYETPS